LCLEELGPFVPLVDVVRVLPEENGGQLGEGEEEGREGGRENRNVGHQ